MSLARCKREDGPTLKYEQVMRERGAEIIAGIDEAGRGALAGPVVAAAVALPPDTCIEGLNDSKQLPPQARQELFFKILDVALATGLGVAEKSLIDTLNIRRATQVAMASAVLDLPLKPDALLVDAMHIPQVNIWQEAIIKGDCLSQSIAAASIIAKVIRDKIMNYYHELFPCYGFDQHKGYATRKHVESVKANGPCRIHRATFRGVREHLYPLTLRNSDTGLEAQ